MLFAQLKVIQTSKVTKSTHFPVPWSWYHQIYQRSNSVTSWAYKLSKPCTWSCIQLWLLQKSCIFGLIILTCCSCMLGCNRHSSLYSWHPWSLTHNDLLCLGSQTCCHWEFEWKGACEKYVLDWSVLFQLIFYMYLSHWYLCIKTFQQQITNSILFDTLLTCFSSGNCLDLWCV